MYLKIFFILIGSIVSLNAYAVKQGARSNDIIYDIIGRKINPQTGRNKVYSRLEGNTISDGTGNACFLMVWTQSNDVLPSSHFYAKYKSFTQVSMSSENGVFYPVDLDRRSVFLPMI